jgi:hypothetical protein
VTPGNVSSIFLAQVQRKHCASHVSLLIKPWACWGYALRGGLLAEANAVNKPDTAFQNMFQSKPE